MSDIRERYTAIRTKRLEDGREVYTSLRPKPVTEEPTDIEIDASDRTRFDLLASQYLRSPLRCWRIAALNKQVDGRLRPTAGNLRIPTQ